MLILNSAHFASSSSGLGALGVGWQPFVIQLITFILAYLVLRKFAFGPIVKILNERRKVVEDGVKLGEKMRVDEVKLKERIDKVLHDTRNEADQIISEAKSTAKDLVREAETDAKGKAEILLTEARENAKQEIESAKRKLEREMIGLVADTATALIDEKVDVRTDENLIKRALERSSGKLA